MATTKDEQTPQEKAQKVVVVSKEITEDQVQALYQQGKNLYEIARTVFGFEGDEAVGRIRTILGIHQPQGRDIE